MSETKEAVMYIAAIKLPAGKLAAQVAHAAVECYRKGKRSHSQYCARKRWLLSPAKVVLRLGSEDEAAALIEAARHINATCVVIRDAGRTTVEPGTLTAVAIGPIFKDEDGPWRALKLY